MPRLCLDCGELYLNNSQIKCSHCNSENTEIINSSITMGEYFKICNISKNGNFIKTMIELYDTDTIEYQLKMQQFNNQNQNMSNTPKCPTCGSTNIQKISASAKLGGAMMFGIFSKTAKSQWKCRNCGSKW